MPTLARTIDPLVIHPRSPWKSHREGCWTTIQDLVSWTHSTSRFIFTVLTGHLVKLGATLQLCHCLHHFWMLLTQYMTHLRNSSHHTMPSNDERHQSVDQTLTEFPPPPEALAETASLLPAPTQGWRMNSQVKSSDWKNVTTFLRSFGSSTAASFALRHLPAQEMPVCFSSR